jgi:succinoglycan biosynthesis protein ExoM
MKVAICIITFRRPEGLKRLLESLNRLEFKKVPPPGLQLVVVDNDPAGLAHAYCQRIRPEMKWPLVSCVEPRRGIAAARNTSLAHVPADANFIAFIDDDEYAEPDWMEGLVCAQQTHSADVVSGVVMSEFEEGIPDWVRKGGFFQRRRFRTGERMKLGTTGNVLVRTAVLRELGTAFDEQFSLTGGEDTHLFTRIFVAGYKIIFANEAVVHELVPASRANIRWLVMRAYSGGSIRSRCERAVMPSLKSQCKRFAVGVARMAQGVCLIVPGCFLGRVTLVKGLHWFFVGAGMVAGLVGARCEQYRQIHGK